MHHFDCAVCWHQSSHRCPEISHQTGEPELCWLLPASLRFLCVCRMLPAPLMTYQYQRSFIKAASESQSGLPGLKLSGSFLIAIASATYSAAVSIQAEIPVFVFSPAEMCFKNGLENGKIG